MQQTQTRASSPNLCAIDALAVVTLTEPPRQNTLFANFFSQRGLAHVLLWKAVATLYLNAFCLD
jgi:hypothetical protein